MRNLCLFLIVFSLVACGPTQEEQRQAEIERQRVQKEAAEKLAREKSARVAAVTCAVINETRKMDAAIRVREVNSARESIGAPPYTIGDDIIVEAVKFGLCEDLVLNDNFLPKILDAQTRAREQKLEQERIAAEKRAEEQRVAAEKRAEEQRIAAEKLDEAKRLVAKFTVEGRIDFFGIKLDSDFTILELVERQQKRNIEVGDQLVEIRSESVDLVLLSNYLTKDLSDAPPAMSVTIERNGEKKRRSIRIR